MKELTPFQEAKKRKMPYIKLVIDQRYLNSTTGRFGRLEIEGPVTAELAEKAKKLWCEIVREG